MHCGSSVILFCSYPKLQTNKAMLHVPASQEDLPCHVHQLFRSESNLSKHCSCMPPFATFESGLTGPQNEPIHRLRMTKVEPPAQRVHFVRDATGHLEHKPGKRRKAKVHFPKWLSQNTGTPNMNGCLFEPCNKSTLQKGHTQTWYPSHNSEAQVVIASNKHATCNLQFEHVVDRRNCPISQ